MSDHEFVFRGAVISGKELVRWSSVHNVAFILHASFPLQPFGASESGQSLGPESHSLTNFLLPLSPAKLQSQRERRRE